MSAQTNDSFLQWDPAQVSSYIDSIDLEPKMGSLFLEHNIEGSLLPFLTTEHLKELGIDNLAARLFIKKGISALITAHYEANPPKSFNDPEYRLTGVNINNNFLNMESLVFSTVMLRELVKKGAQYTAQHSPLSDNSSEIKRLNDNFTRLKSDLIPVIRLLKDSKPLPTPTLDPGHSSSTNVDSPTLSIMSNQSSNSVGNTLIEGLQDAGLLSSSSPGSNRNSLPIPSPTASRFSSGTLLSLGTGKIVGGQAPEKQDRNYRPRLVENSAPSTASGSFQQQKSFRKHPVVTAASTSNLSSVSTSATNEPLKQLRASSEDSCLKILQQAMKRHHIPRDDWSRYVLVICYGDKERILKLTEKPVIIFKELQELGKHPAIMLRQLAETTTVQDNASDELYEDSRIGDDIPGGTL